MWRFGRFLFVATVDGHPVSRLVSRHHSPIILAGVLATTLALLAACAAPGASPGASSSGPSPASSPTSALTPMPSPSPMVSSSTPAATPAPATWSSLAWTRADKTFVFGLIDVSTWSGGYLGIGQVWDTDEQPTAAFLASADGLAWQVTQRLVPGEDLQPWRLLATDDGLLAVIRSLGEAPQLWRSSDGRSWQKLSSPTWQGAWTADQRLLALASGQAGLVAVGGGPEGALALFSADGGRSWQPTSLAADAGAEARSVVATDDGFVAVGAVGGRVTPAVHEILGGRSAAWTSPDGLIWQAAQIEPAADADRLTFNGVYAAAEGLLAIAADTSGEIPGVTAQAWASKDGRSWQPLGVLGQVVPRGSLAGDGERMLILDPGDWSPFSEMPWSGYHSGWTSLDGQTWTPVSFSGQLMDQQSADGWWLTDSGLIYGGTDQLWLAAAS